MGRVMYGDGIGVARHAATSLRPPLRPVTAPGATQALATDAAAPVTVTSTGGAGGFGERVGVR